MSTGFKNIVEMGTIAFELAGIGIIFTGFMLAAWRALRATLVDHDGRAGYDEMRGVFGRTVLLGLEVLVAADIIRTVAVDPTLNNMFVLGMLVLIRTFLSWSLEIELEGMAPWKRWELTKGPQTLGPDATAVQSRAAASDATDEAL